MAYVLRTRAIEIRGASLTEVCSKWAKIKNQLEDFEDATIIGISHDMELEEVQQLLDAGWPVSQLCSNDTNGDGDCHKCSTPMAARCVEAYKRAATELHGQIMDRAEAANAEYQTFATRDRARAIDARERRDTLAEVALMVKTVFVELVGVKIGEN